MNTKYVIWDRISPINGINALYFLQTVPFKGYAGDIILTYGENGSIINIDRKDIMAEGDPYIDPSLPFETFIDLYEKRNELIIQKAKEAMLLEEPQNYGN